MKTNVTVPIEVQKNVCIIGNLNIDLIIRNVSQMPEWGQEVFGDNYNLVSAGQSAYTASALSKYRVPVGIISNLGDDIYGDKILNDLGSAGINLSEVEKVEDGNTGITVAAVRKDGERAFISDPSSLSDFNRDTVNRHLSFAESSSIVCIVGNFFLPGFLIEDIGFFCEKFKNEGITTMLDTGWDSENWPRVTVKKLRDELKYIDYFIPNIDEAQALTKERKPEKAADKLLSDGCGMVVIKLGEEGSYLRSTNEEIFVPSFKTEVFDAVGAGDVFNAGFIYGTLNDWPMEAGMIFGSATASLYISRLTNRFPELCETIELANKNKKFEYTEDNKK